MADDPHDAARMAEISARLGEAVDVAFRPWVRSVVAERHPPAVRGADRLADGLAGRVLPALHRLLAADIDEQPTTPLALLRHAGDGIDAFLRAAGAPPAALADEIGPLTWADLGPDVAEAGLAWGAAKAHLHRRRRSADANSERGGNTTETFDP